jgi:hypothetical protein
MTQMTQKSGRDCRFARYRPAQVHGPRLTARIYSNRRLDRELLSPATVPTTSTRGVMLVLLSVCALACNYPALAPMAHDVTVTILPPPPSCERIASIRGRAGTEWPPAETYPEPHQSAALTTYAMNDLRNNAAAVGANYVQRSEPTLSWGTRVTAEYAGVAYLCPKGQGTAKVIALRRPEDVRVDP